MDSAVLGGLAILIIAGVTNGSFTLPMKFTRKWAWENTWLIYSLWALFVLPPLVTWLTVPGLGALYAGVPGSLIAVVAGCGAGWGISQIFFGLAVEGVGIALAFSVILGLAAAVGSLVPFLRDTPGQIFEPSGLKLLFGLALVLIGVGICAVAGRRREAALAHTVVSGAGGTAAAMVPEKKVSVALGMVYCVISGVGSALVGIGLHAGQPIRTLAEQSGVAAIWAPNAVWLPLMVAGGIPGVLYCMYLVAKNKTGNRFGTPGTASYFLLAGVMAIFWFGSTLLYGIGEGKLGTVIAWPVFMSLIVIVASILGVLTGEWKGSGPKPIRIMYGGIGVLIAAIIVLSRP